MLHGLTQLFIFSAIIYFNKVDFAVKKFQGKKHGFNNSRLLSFQAAMFSIGSYSIPYK
jgi:hypothetical protein